MGARIPTHGVKLLTERPQRRSSAASADHVPGRPACRWPTQRMAERRSRCCATAPRRTKPDRVRNAAVAPSSQADSARHADALGIRASTTLSTVTETARPGLSAPDRDTDALCRATSSLGAGRPACRCILLARRQGGRPAMVRPPARPGQWIRRVCGACLGPRTYSPYRRLATRDSRSHRLHGANALYGASNECPIVFPETILWRLPIPIGSSTAAHFRLSSMHCHFNAIKFIPDLEIHSHQI